MHMHIVSHQYKHSWVHSGSTSRQVLLLFTGTGHLVPHLRQVILFLTGTGSCLSLKQVFLFFTVCSSSYIGYFMAPLLICWIIHGSSSWMLNTSRFLIIDYILHSFTSWTPSYSSVTLKFLTGKKLCWCELGLLSCSWVHTHTPQGISMPLLGVARVSFPIWDVR